MTGIRDKSTAGQHSFTVATATVMSLFSAMTLFLCSCVRLNMPAWSDFAEISGEGWDPTDMVVFEPVPFDSLAPAGTHYDFEMVMRATARHRPGPLPLAICVEDQNGVIRADTIIVGDVDGPELTRSRHYGVEEISFPLLEDLSLSDGMTISFVPLIEADVSRGLLNIGLVMTEHSPDKKPLK